MDSLKIVTIQRERIIKELLPDTCQIFPRTGANITVDGTGILHSDDPVARTWRGLSDIPCRIDLSRAFRPDKLKMQATEVDEFNLELPFDVTVEPEDIIIIRDERFEIRKMKNLSAFDGTVELIIAVIGAHTDANA